MLFLSLFFTYDLPDRKIVIFSLLLGVEYAAIDEIHQLFVADRSGSIIDVGIDEIGVAIGVSVTMLIYKLVNKLLKKKKEGV